MWFYFVLNMILLDNPNKYYMLELEINEKIFKMLDGSFPGEIP